MCCVDVFSRLPLFGVPGGSDPLSHSPTTRLLNTKGGDGKVD